MDSEKGQGWLQFDPQMLVALSAMLAIGLLAVHSAMYREPSWFTKQILSVLVGIVLMLVAARIPYHFWHRRSALLILLAILSLAAVLVFGKELYGARRQFVIGGISLQPSEFCKLAVIIYVADWLSSRGKQIRQINYGLIPFSVILGVVAGLILREPDISTAIVMVLTAGTMFFVAGAELLQIFISAGFGTLAVSVVITQTSYASDRIHKYLAVLNDPLAISPSPISLCLAGLRNGKWLGVGLGKGDYKLWIEPAHSDLIMAVIGEELGLLGTLTVVVLVAWFAYRGFRTALRAPDSMGMLLAAGVTTWLTVQAAIHAGVITATMPTTGMTLPFISAGGSSMMASLAGVGLLTSVWRASAAEGTLNARNRLRWRDWRTRLSSTGSD